MKFLYRINLKKNYNYEQKINNSNKIIKAFFILNPIVYINFYCKFLITSKNWKNILFEGLVIYENK
jgi:hypothetical protein